MDDIYKKMIEGKKIWIFQIGVIGQDGEEKYTALTADPDTMVSVYIQVGDDWDPNNIRAIWMDQKENLGELQVFPKEVNGEELQFAKLELEHFSTYALIFREKET